MTPKLSTIEEAIVAAMNRFRMTDQKERAMFMAQIAHETGKKHMFEIWGPTAAQRRYENNSRLGNNQPGDGYKYRGRGYIQLTGRYNYTEAGKYIGVDLANSPDLAANPDIAVLVAMWYWQIARGSLITTAARKGDVKEVTRLINGGYNGLSDRQTKYVQYLNRKDVTTYTPVN